MAAVQTELPSLHEDGVSPAKPPTTSVDGKCLPALGNFAKYKISRPPPRPHSSPLSYLGMVCDVEA